MDPVVTPDTKKAKVSGNDTTPGYLEDKVVAGANVTVTTLNDGANETLSVAAPDAVTAGAVIADNAVVRGDGGAKGIQGSTVTLDDSGNIGNTYSLTFDTASVQPCAEGTMRWDADFGTVVIGMKGGNVCQQVGQEVMVYGKASEAILNGQAVYVDGAFGANPSFSLASNDVFSESLVIGVATEDISLGGLGYVTIIGNVNDIDTSGIAEGAIAWLGLNGAITATRPTAPSQQVVVGICTRQSATVGRLLTKVDIIPRLRGLSDVYSPNTIDQMMMAWNAANSRWEEYYTTPRTGFPNRTDTTIGMNGSNFEITSVGASYEFYEDGVRYEKSGTQSIAITSDLADNFVYYEGGVLTTSTTPWAFRDGKAWVAAVYKDGSNYSVGEERHSANRPQDWHDWAHNTIGARYASGLTGSFTNTTFSVAQGVTYDEDISNDTGGAQTTCRHWYRNASLTAMRFTTGNTTPYPLVGGIIAYDNAGTLTAASLNRYVSMWVYSTNDIDEPIFSVPGQAEYTNQSAAESEQLPSILLPVAEWKLIYHLVFQRTAGGPVLISTIDERATSTGPAFSGSGVSHTSLIDRDDANSHPATAVSYDNATSGLTASQVQAAIDELSTEKVDGPASATDNAFYRYDGTSGKLAQNSQTTEDDSGNVAIAGTGSATSPSGTGAALDVAGGITASGESYFGDSMNANGDSNYPSIGVSAYEVGYTAATARSAAFFQGNYSLGASTSSALKGVAMRCYLNPNGYAYSGIYSAFEANAYATGSSGTVSQMRGISNTMVFAGSGGTISDAYGAITIAQGTNSGQTITNLYGNYISHTNMSGHTVANQYGLYLGTVNLGTTNNYAIYTNLGKIRFGDTTAATSTTAAALTVSGGAGIGGELHTGGKLTVAGQTTSGLTDLASVIAFLKAIHT